MFWKVTKISGCSLVPEYCYGVMFEGFDGEEDRWVQSTGDDIIGFSLHQANTVASILNQQIEDTEASLRLNTFNVQLIKEIN